jgi:zeta-carotene desaturase
LNRRVAIIGGGLAGIAAAVRLAEAGHRPVLIETSRRLGGRATSFVDPRSGEELDNCQHVLLGCCTNLIDLYERIGVLDSIEWHRTLYWTRGAGQVDRLKPGLLPAPLHLAGSMRRMRIFERDDKRHIRRAMWRIVRLGDKGRLDWADRPFGEFLTECRQPPGLVGAFWNTIITSACNLGVERVAADAAIQVFQQGYLANRWSCTMGLSRGPLARLYDPAAQAIEAAGGEILLGTSARGIAYGGRRVTGVVTASGVVDASAVISAVPFDRLSKLVSDAMRAADRRLQDLERFEASPILGVHLHFDQPIMDLPHLILVDHGVQWLFNKGVDESGRQHIHAVISAADEWMPLAEEEIIARVVGDVHAALPHAVGLAPVQARAIKEKRATFAATPGIGRYRPSAAPGYVGVGGGGIENLFLAGDWCDTGWPATMEGAVRSGYLAAAAAASDGAPADTSTALVEDVPVAPLARWLGLR